MFNSEEYRVECLQAEIRYFREERDSYRRWTRVLTFLLTIAVACNVASLYFSW